MLHNMQITLINPPQVFSKTQVTAGVVPPLGILYLSSFLKQHGHSVTVIDAVGDRHNQYTAMGKMTLRGLSFLEIIEKIPRNAEFIGISLLYSSAFLPVQKLIALIKKVFPDALIILGGAHASCLPEYTLQNTDADVIIIGEGELPLLNICRRRDDLESIPGVVYKKDGAVHFNPPEELIKDLDSLPFPDWRAINLENYFKAAEPHGCSYSQKWAPLIAGRGCPYECTFCTTPLIWRQRWRIRSVENVLAEMEYLHKTFGVQDFHFEDENMGTDEKWLHKFSDTLIEKRLPITWQPSNGIRVEPLRDPGLMSKMRRGGCSLLVFTLESASERVRNQIIRKHLDIKTVEQIILSAKKENIKTTCYFMIGLPGETLQEAKATIRYARFLARKGLDECVISLFSLLPGCELFNDFYTSGKVNLDPQFFEDLLSIGDMKKFKSWTDDISGNNLKKLRFNGYAGFVLIKLIFHPMNMIKSIGNIMRGRDRLKSERVVRIFLKRMIARAKLS